MLFFFKSTFIFILFFFIFFSLLFGGIYTPSGEYYRFGQSYRSMSMGNTGVTSANDSSALFYNPAAMANITNWWWDYLMLQIAVSEDVGALQEVIQEQQGLSFDDPKGIANFIKEVDGLHPYFRFTLASVYNNAFLKNSANGGNVIINLNDKGWTIGASGVDDIILDIQVGKTTITSSQIQDTYDLDLTGIPDELIEEILGVAEGYIGDLEIPEINVLERWDTIKQIGISIPLGMGQWILGFGVKQITRREIKFNYNLLDSTENVPFPEFPDDLEVSTDIGYDVGLIFRAANASRFNIGFVIQNIGDISKEDGVNQPQEVSLGMSIMPEFSIFRYVLAIDIRDITYQHNQENEKNTLAKRIHIGTELGIFPYDDLATSFISLRAGYNQGYFTWGAEINLNHGLVLGFASYSEEVAEIVPEGQTQKSKPNHRKMYYLSLGF